MGIELNDVLGGGNPKQAHLTIENRPSAADCERGVTEVAWGAYEGLRQNRGMIWFTR